MKRQFFLLRIVALLAGFASVACSSNDEPVMPPVDPVDPVGPSLFEISVSDISAVGVTIGISPADKQSTYYWDVLDDNDFSVMERNGVNDYLQWFLEERLMGEFGYSFTEAVKMMTSSGDEDYEMSGLEPGTKYHVIAVGINSEAYATTEVVSKEFTTLAPVSSDNTFSSEVSDVGHTSARIAVETANADPYFLDIRPVGIDEGLTDAEYARYLIDLYTSWGGLPERCHAGDKTISNTEMDAELKPGWKYEVIAFGYQDGMITTDVTRVPMETLSGGDPASCSFAFDYTLAAYTYSNFVTTPSEPLAVYVSDVIEESLYQHYLDFYGGDREQVMNAVLKSMVDFYAEDFHSRVETVEAIAQVGETNFDMNLTPDTEYRMWAVCVDQYGQAAAPFAVGEPFRSLKQEPSTAGIALKEYHWYDGDALYEAEPETFASARGYAVLAVLAEPTADAAHWYLYSFLGDLTGSSDRNVINNLVGMGDSSKDQTEMLIICYWGENTICGVAQDAAGNYGPILREVVDLTKEGASPVPSDFRAKTLKSPRRIADLTERARR